MFSSTMMRRKAWLLHALVAAVATGSSSFLGTRAFSSSGSMCSSFCGRIIQFEKSHRRRARLPGVACLSMRKQKASDKRTRRMQRGITTEQALGILNSESTPFTPMTSSPMATATWQHKSIDLNTSPAKKDGSTGRGRSRKRSLLYNSLASYHAQFLSLLNAEYLSEEAEVLNRIDASFEDPLKLEVAGHALFDLYPERRGDIFSDEVYRLVKARDATTAFPLTGRGREFDKDGTDLHGKASASYLPQNHKFAANDVILLTLQPKGSGDFFGTSTLPTSKKAVSVEARVLNTGPTYVDIAVAGGAFEAAFGPAPNNNGLSGRGDPGMRLRADRFFSNIPYTRMVAALGQITSIPEKQKRRKDSQKHETGEEAGSAETRTDDEHYGSIVLDEVLREAVLSTYAYNDPLSILYEDSEACRLRDLARKLARPPLPNSAQLANQALAYMQSNPKCIFPNFNAAQITAIGAALTRRLTLIQGPPGTGKTTVAASIAFGFVHQCRSVSSNTKVLACASSNIGADNLAEQLLSLGLKVVRIGRASAVSESLWDFTLDAAIARDPDAQKASRDAAIATANLGKGLGRKGNTTHRKGDLSSLRNKREIATTAVKACIQASKVAATKALREADVIVSTSIGAADSRLLAACGIETYEDDSTEEDSRLKSQMAARVKRTSNYVSDFASNGKMQVERRNAPDDLPPLSLPFVIIDEACQCTEPENLIPVTSTNSCRSLVLLGDPCQLPPTVRTDLSGTGTSPLSVSLMARLASSLPQPVIVRAQPDKTEKDDYFLQAKPTKRAVSLVHHQNGPDERHVSYRKRFSGSLLLSVQYRMHPSISAFSSAIFYDGLLSTPAKLGEYRPFPRSLNDLLPCNDPALGVRFVNIGGGMNEQKGDLTSFSPTFSHSSGDAISGANASYRNEAEAHYILSLLKDLLRNRHFGDSSFPESIGIVTPYSSQVALIKSLLAGDSEFRSLALDLSSSIEVKSVDGYQGRERDLIIFSAVRSNNRGSVGFLTDWRRMNVAITRAKSGLVVIGDLDTLKEGDKHWEAFGNWCQAVGCLNDSDAALSVP